MKHCEDNWTSNVLFNLMCYGSVITYLNHAAVQNCEGQMIAFIHVGRSDRQESEDFHKRMKTSCVPISSEGTAENTRFLISSSKSLGSAPAFSGSSRTT